jgi:GntR family transcriptional regulator
VAETIKGRILEALYKPGERIPPARELMKEFGVSNITIRKAIERLAQEGWVNPRQGVGTTVARAQWDRVEIKLSGSFRDWFESASGKLARLRTELLSLKTVVPPSRVRDLLQLSQKDPLWCMVRKRRYRSRPVSRFINYFPLPPHSHLTHAQVRDKAFIELYQEITGIRFTHLTQQVEAVTADMDLANALEVPFGAPLFYVENIYYAKGDVLRALTQMHYRGDSYVYKTKISLENELETIVK